MIVALSEVSIVMVTQQWLGPPAIRNQNLDKVKMSAILGFIFTLINLVPRLESIRHNSCDDTYLAELDADAASTIAGSKKKKNSE